MCISSPPNTAGGSRRAMDSGIEESTQQITEAGYTYAKLGYMHKNWDAPGNDAAVLLQP